MGQEKDNTRQRGWKQLSERERYLIEARTEAGQTPREIGEALGRDRRTIERELVRGRVLQLRSDLTQYYPYRADFAQMGADARASCKGRELKIGYDHRLAAHIEQRLLQGKYSPDATIGEMRCWKEYPFDVTICTKTLYNYIDQGVFANISNKDLPMKRHKKRPYHRIRKVALNNLHGHSIEERPSQIEKRCEKGHWEMDCVVGKGQACLLVLTERSTRLERIFKMPAKTQASVLAVVNQLEQKHKDAFTTLFKSITVDNGSEFLDASGLEASCLNEGERRVAIYYAHPYSAWERGSNENANRLIRRFIPKGSDIAKLSCQEVQQIESWINTYPRRIFNYLCANAVYSAT